MRKCFDPDYWSGHFTLLSQKVRSRNLSPLDLTREIYFLSPDRACREPQGRVDMTRGYNTLIHYALAMNPPH